MAPAQILIVEAEAEIAFDLKERLIDLGYGVTAVVNLAEALMAVDQHLPDLVLIDIGCPDGITTAIQIQQKAPVVFLIADADALNLAQVKAAQPSGYLVRPIANRDLSLTLEMALSQAQAKLSIQQALEREQALNQTKSQFVAIVSHEFRNPLSAILFSLDLLDYPPDSFPPEKRRTYIQRAKTAVERMKHLLEDLLIMGEIEAKHFDYQPQPLPILAFCQDVIEPFQINGAHSIRFVAVGVSAEAQTYSLDERLLRHIVSNLLSNAIKYSPAGGEVQFRLIHQGQQLSFQIQDSGIGIAAADQACLFDSFYRGSNVGTIPGTGLGLAIVKQCVEIHQGQISVASQPGTGATFTVTLEL